MYIIGTHKFGWLVQMIKDAKSVLDDLLNSANFESRSFRIFSLRIVGLAKSNISFQITRLRGPFWISKFTLWNIQLNLQA